VQRKDDDGGGIRKVEYLEIHWISILVPLRWMDTYAIDAPRGNIGFPSRSPICFTPPGSTAALLLQRRAV
jgi:hypothetical protein